MILAKKVIYLYAVSLTGQTGYLHHKLEEVRKTTNEQKSAENHWIILIY